MGVRILVWYHSKVESASLCRCASRSHFLLCAFQRTDAIADTTDLTITRIERLKALLQESLANCLLLLQLEEILLLIGRKRHE